MHSPERIPVRLWALAAGTPAIMHVNTMLVRLQKLRPLFQL